MTVIHLKKKDVVKSSVKGVAIEFDHVKLASILGVPGKNGIFMKNVVPRFGKRDTLSFMDLTYMNHLMSRRLVNLPRVMMRHMSYVISMKDHELPYGDWLTMVFEEFGVPLVDKKGEEPKRADYFEETFLNMFDQFYDAEVDVEEPVRETPDTSAVPASPEQIPVQQKETVPSGVDPSCPSGRIPEAVMNKLQAEFERARANRIQADLEKAQAEDARLLAMLQQAQFKSKP
ncbi:hypothetical protein Dimus_024942 [Dionaea muscipula]